MCIYFCFFGFFFFLFKQKTAYEWRISDWSSDVCSSDLVARLVLLEPELLEDRRDVLLDARLRDEQRRGDGLVGLALGNEREHLAFAFGEPLHPLVAAAPAEQLRDHLGVEDGGPRSDAGARVQEHRHVGDPVVQPVSTEERRVGKRRVGTV